MSLTIAVSDNADGTGGVLTVSGGTFPSLPVVSFAQIYAAPVNGGYPGAWQMIDNVSMNGTLPVDPGTGKYFWICIHVGNNEISNIVYQSLTDPDPALTVIERITAELADRIEDCTIANGYAVSVQSVIRPTRSAQYSPRDKQVVLTVARNVRNADADMAANPARIAYDVEFAIDCILLPSDATTTPYETLCNQFVGEVQRAVCQPAATWQTFGGEAFNAEWGDIEHRLEGDGGPSGCRITLTVYYRTDETDPRIARP